MIRDLTYSDLDQVLALCKEHFDAVGMTDRFYKLDELTAISTLKTFISSSNFESIVVDLDGRVVGICVFSVVSSIFDSNNILGHEVLWYTREDVSRRWFVRLFEEMQDRLHVDRISIGMKYDNETLQNYLTKNDFIKTEITYSKEVRNV